MPTELSSSPINSALLHESVEPIEDIESRILVLPIRIPADEWLLPCLHVLNCEEGPYVFAEPNIQLCRLDVGNVVVHRCLELVQRQALSVDDPTKLLKYSEQLRP